MPDGRPSARQKRAVADRARGCCEYCLSPVAFSPDPFSIEHIRPRVVGGTHHLTNLAFSCLGCNNLKYTATEAVDPLSGETVFLYNPREHRWRDHFAWGDGFLEILGRTAIGRVTVEKLQLNRPGVVNLRRVLRLAGEHPPPETLEEG